MIYNILKRWLDIVISLLGLLLLLPIICLVSLLIWLFIGRPIFFTQLRPGLNEQVFRMIKFRTMSDDRGNNGELLKDASRLTKFGSFLRSTSLDELPELWNVLKGDMSLVGPRPLLIEYLSLYSDRQARRHEVRPGITGWAQINGRNAISWEERFELDVWYVEHHNFMLDMKILLLTLVKVIRAEGINGEGHVTMEKFRGSGS